MKIKITFAVLFITLIFCESFSQWPGYFYTFELKDADGKQIDTTTKEYTGETIVCSGCEENIVLGIRICADNKTWRFYAGGNYTHLNRANFLRIDKRVNGEVSETMTIEFPSSLSGGKDKYYRNLYAGVITFKNGDYKIQLPKTGGEWDNLKEVKLCPDNINKDYSYFDISKFQKQ